MEIKATLNKPYNEEQRISFIVEQNHKNGFMIKETDTALEAWGLMAQEIADKEKQVRKAELISQLDALDLKCIRSLRAIQAGTSTDEDVAKLAELEEQAEAIRKQIKEL